MLRGRGLSIVAVACLVAALIPAATAYAGDSVQLTGKAQMEFVSVTLETSATLDYGSGGTGQMVTKSFTVRNAGSLAADWDLLGSDATDGNDVWHIGTTAAAGQFVWEAKGTGLNTIKLSNTAQRLVDAVPAYSTREVNLALTFPTSSSSTLVHNATATLRATASGAAAGQNVSFDNTKHETLTAEANKPINVTFVPSTMGCSANIAFTSGTFSKTSTAGHNVTYHSDGLPAGTYQWKCSMMNCCYGTLVVQ